MSVDGVKISTSGLVRVHRERLNKQEDGLEEVNARVTRRRKEIDNLNALVGVVVFYSLNTADIKFLDE